MQHQHLALLHLLLGARIFVLVVREAPILSRLRKHSLALIASRHAAKESGYLIISGTIGVDILNDVDAVKLLTASRQTLIVLALLSKDGCLVVVEDKAICLCGNGHLVRPKRCREILISSFLAAAGVFV